MQSLTFVTAIIDIKSECSGETLQFKMEQLSQFLFLLNAPIQILADRGCAEILKIKYKDCENIKIVLFSVEEESWIYQASAPYKDRLPLTRNQTKDTFEHLVWTHMKVEFLQRAIENGEGIFCWIDPHICHLFPDPLSTVNYLNYLSMQKFAKDQFLALPGCWDPRTLDSIDFNTVCWRFCGTFLLGDAASICSLHTLYKHFYPTLLKERNTMTWDINVLAQMEYEGVFTPVWYKANHDASIVGIPTSLYSQNLSDSENTIVEYAYPEVPGFFPSSASYISKTLVTRYVNYKIGEGNRYTVFHPSGQLQTINLLSTLSDDFGALESSQFIDDGAISIPTYIEGARYVGLEDVRIFKSGDKIEFVASSAAYTENHSIRIIKGAICDGKFVSGVVLQPPNGIYTQCEKNWIPIGKSDCYIYRWHPYEIIRADKNGRTTTVSSKVIPNTLFEKVRGSTVPVWSDMDSHYICVVHWTNGSKGLLQYYHMLVKLDATYEVTSWSQPFHFSNLGIQYCLGFTIIDTQTYGFWFSENDGNPKFMRSCSSQFVFHRVQRTLQSYGL
jgi:hypothetical protein